MNFTQRKLELLSEAGTFSDPAVKGLYLRIQQQGKSWFYRRKVAGKTYSLGLGSFKTTNLSQARNSAVKLNDLSKEDFIAYLNDKKQKKEEPVAPEILTFRDVQQMFIDWNIEVGNWVELDKAHKVFEGRMRMYILPVIGNKSIKEVTPADVAKIAQAIWDKPDTVDRCLRFIRQVFNWAKAKEICTQDNPADRSGVLKYLLPQRKYMTKNRGALSVKQLPEFFASIYQEFGQISSGRCFLFSILTATRSGTARFAKWDQIDFEKKEWLIPPEQLKMSENGALIVPLAEGVVSWLQSFKPENASGFIFPNSKGKALSDSMVSRLIKLSNRKGHNWIDEAQSAKTGKTIFPTQHGIARATFRTWSQDDSLGNDKRFDERIAELCLHHKVKDIYNGAYERNQSFIRRREMMNAWADYCFSALKRS